MAALVTATGAAVAGATGSVVALGTDSPATTQTNALQLTSAAETAMLSAPPPSDAPAARAPAAAVQPVAMPNTNRQTVARHAPTPAHTTSTPRRSVTPATSTNDASAPSRASGTIGARIVTEAARHEGTPYVWGATGPSSFDCSGYTSYTFRKMGISLPRTAQQQYDASQHLSRSQAQPGDLIFQGGPNSISHVAIYAGDGKIWTAPQSGESVKLGNLWGNWSVGRIR